MFSNKELPIAKKRLPTLQSDKTIKVVLSPKAILQTRQLCHNIFNLEWCGIFLYNEEGTIEDPDNFKITIHEICPMDIGTAGGTSFDMSEEGIGFDNIVKFRQAHFDLYMEDYRVGFMHSHNNMDVFFSGTDHAELHDNSDKFNYYLSVITNNKNQWTAKIGQVVDTDIKIEAKGAKGTYEPIAGQFGEKMLLITDCDIELDFGTDETFNLLLDNLLADRKKRLAEKASQNKFGSGTYGTRQLNMFDDDKGKVSDNIDLMLRGTLGQQSFVEPVFPLLMRLEPYCDESHREDIIAELRESFTETYEQFEEDLIPEVVLSEMIEELETRVQYGRFKHNVVPMLTTIFKQLITEYEIARATFEV
jgi:hypothetical protein